MVVRICYSVYASYTSWSQVKYFGICNMKYLPRGFFLSSTVALRWFKSGHF